VPSSLASRAKIGSLEFQGAQIRPDRQFRDGIDVYDENGDFEARRASAADFEERKEFRYESRFARPVHAIFPSGDKDFPLRVLVYIVIEKSLSNRDTTPPTTRINDIDRVEYYLGHNFGAGEWGSWFVIKDAINNFAIEYITDDEVMCIAKVYFYDGPPAILRRYLDLEMRPVIEKMESEIIQRDARLKELVASKGSKN